MSTDQTECNHHWHHVNTGYPSGPLGVKVRTDACCHCGETKVTRIEPTPTQSISVDESGCGPFKPETRIYW